MTATTATLNGSISSNGNQTITSDGFDYGTTPHPTGTHVAATTVQSGAFTVNITGLTSGTTYHYRSTAVNASGTGVSSDSQFISGGGEYHTNRHGIRSNQCDGRHRDAEWVHILQW